MSVLTRGGGKIGIGIGIGIGPNDRFYRFMSIWFLKLAAVDTNRTLDENSTFLAKTCSSLAAGNSYMFEHHALFGSPLHEVLRKSWEESESRSEIGIFEGIEVGFKILDSELVRDPWGPQP